MPPRATDHKVDWRIEARRIGQVNWTGMWTLYLREVQRFFKMLLQAVLAPIVTCLWFLAIFTIAFGDGRSVAGLWSEKFDHLSTVTNFVITPLAFLSGTFYSVERLPGMWRELAPVNPLFHMIDGFRHALIGWSDSAPWVAALVIAASALITGGSCYRLLRIGYKLKT